jgi:DNA primase
LSVNDKIIFLKKVFSSVQIAHDGKNAAVSCPNCKNSTKKKLAIKIDSDLVNCWVCGYHGKLIKLLVKFKPNFVNEYVKSFANGNITLITSSEETEQKVVNVPKGFKLLAANLNSTDPYVKAAINYVKNRGLTLRDMWYFKFGVSDEQSLLRRVVMPSFDANGTINFWTGRAIDESAYRKYYNCEFEKKSIIFNEININWKKPLTLVEGPFDLTKCDDNATCLLGSSLTEDSLLFGKIYEHMTPIILALDDDMQTKMWQRIAKMLASYDIDVRILQLNGKHDVGEMTKNEFLAAKESALKWNRDAALHQKISTIRI